MDEIVSRISEIEAATVKIMDDAAIKKRELSKAMDDKIALYDRMIKEETQNKLIALRHDMEKQRKAEIAGLRSQMDKKLAELDTIYEIKHEELAMKVLKALLIS